MVANSTVFFPRLNRRATYIGNGPGRANRYDAYRAEIEEDCKMSCVYCDISLEELGGEGLQLDHFRPENHFPALVNEPLNLLAACPKCNRLKWDHWPCHKKDASKPSYNKVEGFVDPFLENRQDFFSVRSDGELNSVKPPAKYMINLMKLNRTARSQVRRKRMIEEDKIEIENFINESIDSIVTLWHRGDIQPSEAMAQVEMLQMFRQNFSMI